MDLGNKYPNKDGCKTLYKNFRCNGPFCTNPQKHQGNDPEKWVVYFCMAGKEELEFGQYYGSTSYYRLPEGWNVFQNGIAYCPKCMEIVRKELNKENNQNNS